MAMTKKQRDEPSRWLAMPAAVFVAVFATAAMADDILVTKAVPIPYSAPATYDWSGFYVGGHLGYAWGSSTWSATDAGATTPTLFGSFNLSKPFDPFQDTGSFFEGLQAGYNYMLPNRLVIGAEVDASFPSFQNSAGISIGGISPVSSPTLGPETYSETVLSSGSVRGRIGYAPGSWLFYATGGFAWTYDQLTLTQLASGTTDLPFLWRLGRAAGAGVEVSVAPHWTARLEYLLTDYGISSVSMPAAAQQFSSDFRLQELRVGLNYQFGSNGSSSETGIVALATPGQDVINFHGQTTFVEQAYPGFRSPYQGAQSLPGGGQGRETADATLFAGVRLWRGAELWVNPEIDQGFGLANTFGVAGFTSGDAYKVGFDYPYARLPRTFIRQTIDLGGDPGKLDAGLPVRRFPS